MAIFSVTLRRSISHLYIFINILQMIFTKSIANFGKYCLFMRRVFSVPDKWRVFFSRTVFEIQKLGVDSIPLVIIIALFIGAVITIQM